MEKQIVFDKIKTYNIKC